MGTDGGDPSKVWGRGEESGGNESHGSQSFTSVKQEGAQTEMITEDQQITPQTHGRDECKIKKPPQICIFSGSNPIPKEEGSYEQWKFQVRRAMATHTKNSVHAAIVNSL